MSPRSLIVAAFVASSTALTQETPELRQWAAPPYWAPAGPPAGGEVDERGGKQGGREALALPSSPLPFVAIPPCRIVDTRGGAPFTGGKYLAGESRDYQFSAAAAPCNGIPATAAAFSLNFTVTQTDGAGFLAAYPRNGRPVPLVSTLNYTGGQTLANGAVVPGDSTGFITVIAGVAGTHVIVDVNGYYAGTGVVTSVNTKVGDVTLAAGTNVTITPSGNTLTIAAAGGGGGGGTVTSVGTGAGLTGGPITSTGTVSVASGGITSSMIASGAVGLSQIDSSQVQARVTSTCPAGSTIQTINADGSVVCTGTSPLVGSVISTLDSVGDVARSTSITIGLDGLGLISYWDYTNRNLKVAHCSDAACTAATLSTLDSTGDVGDRNSITIGSDGLGLISYYDTTNGNLKVAHCSNAFCTPYVRRR